MLFIKLPWQSKSKLPFFPYPREYWTVGGNEPYSWTDEDIEYAKATGWYSVQEQQEDEYPYLKGIMSGNDPEHGFGWYLPKKPWSRKVDNVNRINPDPSIYTRYCEYCESWHIAGASYRCRKDLVTGWTEESDLLGGLAAMADEIENDVGMTDAQVSKAQTKDTFYQFIQQLYLLGWTSEQVVSFAKSIVRHIPIVPGSDPKFVDEGHRRGFEIWLGEMVQRARDCSKSM